MDRRRFLTVGTALAGTTVAGCLGPTGQDDDQATGSSDDARDGDGEPAASSEGDQATGGYTVSMEPMGPVEFDAVPTDWVALLASYGDMGFALGAGQTLGTQLPYRYASHYYEELPGVTYDADAVRTLNQNGVDKELFYEMDADVHLMEPNQLVQWYDWSHDDVAEIEDNVGPFVGNFIRRRSDDWHDYPYYSLYGAFEKIADVFQARDRYEAFHALHDEVVADVEADLPAPADRPEAMLVYPADSPPSSFYPYRLREGGVAKKHWRDLGLHDAFANSDVGHYQGDTSLTIDFETMLEIDPELLIVRGQVEKTDEEFQSSVVDYLADHPVASKVTAVDEGAVVRGGYLDQGPIIHLFQLETAAQRIYPDRFGGEELFSRDRVANVVRGSL